MKKIYLSIPYTGLKEKSFLIANELTAKLMGEGHIVYSPITHGHPLHLQENMPHDWEFWKKIDTAFVDWADETHVVLIGGRELGLDLINKSIGCTYEIEHSSQTNKPVHFIEYTGKYAEYATEQV